MELVYRMEMQSSYRRMVRLLVLPEGLCFDCSTKTQ